MNLKVHFEIGTMRGTLLRNSESDARQAEKNAMKRQLFSLVLLVTLVAVPATTQTPMNGANLDPLRRMTAHDFDRLRKLARGGDPVAANALGMAYAFGVGTERDDVEALHWFQKAADRNLANAQNNVGVMYQLGRGTPQNAVEAMKWFRKAAENGDTQGQFDLASAYFNGWGTDQNYEQALKWYMVLALKDSAQAQNVLGYMYESGLGVTPDNAEAIKWYRKAAEHSLPLAEHNLAVMYMNGRGVTKDVGEALHWFTRASNHGYAPAQKAAEWLVRHRGAEALSQAKTPPE